MEARTSLHQSNSYHKGSRALRILSMLMTLNLILGLFSLTPPTPVQAADGTVTLSVISARDEPAHPGGAVLKGDSVPEYKYLINADDVGDPTQPRFPDCSPYFEDPFHPGMPDVNHPNLEYPDKCNWPSIRQLPGGSPVITQGDQADFAGGGSLSLPPGNYLISVQSDTYKIGGQHFTVPDGGAVAVTVELQPHPLPPATLSVFVFEDISPTNGAVDAPAELGLAGFKVTINEILGQVSTDVFGNPLCTLYDANGDPLPPPAGKPLDWCLYSGDGSGSPADPTYRALGDVKVPNLGPNRFDIDVFPPAGSPYVQTTTLEGSTGWDTWLQEGATGLDNEFVVAGEPFPWTWAGFVKPTDTLNNASVTGGITGRIVGASYWVPQNGGLPYYGAQWGGLNGAKPTGPIPDAWISLADLQNGDTAVWIGPANADGTFTIDNVPDGSYFFTYWDYQLHYIMDWMTVTVTGGQVTDLATPFLTGWFTWVSGYVFTDLNGNGFRDEGEPGIAEFPVVLKERENTVMDRMTVLVTTDSTGFYYFDRAYPLGSWMVLEAYSDRYYTTGVSYKVENQPDWTTVLGSGVDVGVLPILGHSGQLDWGVRPYDPTGATGPRNGGIVGTVSYDVTRNELDPRFAVVEDWQPGIPGITMQVWTSVACGTNPGSPCDSMGMYELDADGAYKKGLLINEAVTESWEQPIDCTPRDADGNPVQQLAFPTAPGKRCLEAPMMGLQFQSDFSTVDGNYGFGDGCFGIGGFDPNTGACADGSQPIELPPGEYLVNMIIPNDATANARPLYKVTREEDINIFGGDQFTPQVPPPACAGPLHTVDVAGIGTDGYPAQVLPNGVTVPASTPTINPTFTDGGGNPYEGMAKPLCDTKLVTVSTGKSIAPTFNLFTDVEIPGKWKGYIIDDLTISMNAMDLNFGEKAGVANSPIGIYDYTNRLVKTITSDPNGVYEVLLPSTWSINCPSPSGVCPGTYYLLGNDPGQPGAPNPNYNPAFRTIGASFEIWPGRLLPSDLAPTQIAVSVLNPGSNQAVPVTCALDAVTPQLFAVSQPYAQLNYAGASNVVISVTPGSLTLSGMGFGAAAGTVTLDDVFILPTTAWSDTSITVTLPNSTPQGVHQLKVTGANGQKTVNGLSLHILGRVYNPTLYWVNPPAGLTTVPARTFTSAAYTGFPGPIQAAINAAAGAAGKNDLVVVFPGPTTQWNPLGAYYENLVINTSVKLQGVGPGGVRPDTSFSLGSVIDGANVVGDTAYATAWQTFVGSLTWDGNQTLYEGPVIYLLVRSNEFVQTFRPAIDGFTIKGGDQQGFPNFLPGAEPGGGGVITVQGGGIFANAYARYLQISNNVLSSNGGAYGGAIRLGTPNLPGAANDNQNDDVRILNNRIIANGGTNLAGAVGIFSGANNYEVAGNDICGNFSAEYGGGISQYGYSPNGRIHHNRIYFNRSYDEGGGIMLAGELPANPALLSPGTGPVDVYNNLIQSNLSNDDGGGIRFLMAGNFIFNVYNNMIVNNISTHEGGGISLNDAPSVRVYNNTVMKNITTATSATSNGFPAPAGLATGANTQQLQATLPPGSSLFSNPVLFNNIFWDNRAGTFDGGGVSGIGITGDPNPINNWDIGAADFSGLLSPVNSILQSTDGTILSGTNLSADPLVVSSYDTVLSILPWRGNANFVDTQIVVVEQPINIMSNYHLNTGSPAIQAGIGAWLGVIRPQLDYDDQCRPFFRPDAGADQLTAVCQLFAPLVGR